MVVDELAKRWHLTAWKSKHDAQQAMFAPQRALLVKPTKFMNSSGIPIKLIAHFYRIEPAGILVITDDVDLPFGRLRMRPGGGHGGHNGLRSVIAMLDEDFPRLRVGIGRPEYETVDHVLTTFNGPERAKLQEIIDAAADGAERWLASGIELAMNFVNKKEQSQ